MSTDKQDLGSVAWAVDAARAAGAIRDLPGTVVAVSPEPSRLITLQRNGEPRRFPNARLVAAPDGAEVNVVVGSVWIPPAGLVKLTERSGKGLAPTHLQMIVGGWKWIYPGDDENYPIPGSSVAQPLAAEQQEFEAFRQWKANQRRQY